MIEVLSALLPSLSAAVPAAPVAGAWHGASLPNIGSGSESWGRNFMILFFFFFFGGALPVTSEAVKWHCWHHWLHPAKRVSEPLAGLYYSVCAHALSPYVL